MRHRMAQSDLSLRIPLFAFSAQPTPRRREDTIDALEVVLIRQLVEFCAQIEFHSWNGQQGKQGH